MADKGRFSKLLEPGTIGRVKTKNRMVRTAAGVDFVDKTGRLKLKQELPFYEALARGGIGWIIIGAQALETPLSSGAPWQANIARDELIPSYRQLADIAHKYNVPIFMQFMHPGAWRVPTDKLQPVSASSIPLEELQARAPEFTVVPRELTIPEIKQIQEMFANVAERAMKAGFDGIEINSATCHLGNSFLSRGWNRRQDAYGYQSFENRARFVVETKEAIKKRIGQDVPVGVLMNGAEYGMKDGITPEEAQEFAKIFEKAGFDYLNVRAFGYMEYFDLHLPDSIYFPEPPPLPAPLDGSRHGAGITVPLAAGIKKQVSIPIIIVGKLDAELGEEILEDGSADYIGLARPLIADPDYPNKVAAGKFDDIAPCTYCLSCFGYVVDRGEDLRCRINAAVGGEEDYAIPAAPKKKKVAVVGAGPGGMEAARVAALRGHDVTLFEKAGKLGGLIHLAAMIKGLEVEDLEAIVRYYKTQLTKLGVNIKLKTEATPAVIEQFKPDAVVVATGGIPTAPQIPGINRRNVLTMPDLHRRVKGYLNFFGPNFLRSLTRLYMPVGKKVVIMGGALHGCEIAEFLIKRGRQVTIVDTANTLEDPRLPRARTLRLFRWFAKKGVTLMTGVKYEEITDKGLTITTKDGKRQTLEADNIVPVMPLAPNPELTKSLQGKVPEVYSIGDCTEPGLILDAIAGGYRVARKL